jgi:hypothetical protein
MVKPATRQVDSRTMIGESREQRRRKRMEDELQVREAHEVVPESGVLAFLDRCAWLMCRQTIAGSWHWGGPILLLLAGCWRDVINGDHGVLLLDAVGSGLIALRAHLVHERFVSRREPDSMKIS